MQIIKDAISSHENLKSYGDIVSDSQPGRASYQISVNKVTFPWVSTTICFISRFKYFNIKPGLLDNDMIQ